MKRILNAIAVLTMVIVAGGWIYFSSSSSQPGHVDGDKLLSAVKIYKGNLKRQGMDVPASVSLKELIARGLLTEADMSGFWGLDISVILSADEIRPQNVLMRARFPDGHEIVALGDGSVQQVRR